MICLSALALAATVALPTGPLDSIPAKLLAAKPKATQVVAKVNGQAITVADVDSLLWTWYSDQVREETINYLVVKTEAAKQSVKVPASEVEAEVAKQIKLYAAQLGPGADVEKNLKAQGLHRSRLFMGVETQMLIKKLMLRRFDSSEFVNVATIIVKPKSDLASDEAEAIAKAQEAYNKLTAGTPWDDVLKTYTTDPNGLKAKGVLGWRLVSIFPASVQAEFKTLKIGGFTKPTRTQAGIQVFRLDKLGKDVKEPELQQLKDMYVGAGQNEFMAKLKAAAKIVRVP